MLLAATVGHTADVDAFLMALTPQEFDEWRAFYQLAPWYIGYPIGTGDDEPKQDSLSTFKQLAGF